MLNKESAEDLANQLNDKNLIGIINTIPLSDGSKYDEIKERFNKYDPGFLWMIAYTSEDSKILTDYVKEKIQKYRQILDSGFLKKLASKDGFVSHMWELVLCDYLSQIGSFIPKSAAGSDFIFVTKKGQKIQVEAVAPNESDDPNLKPIRPDYSKNKIVSISGKIDDLEMPVVLRVEKAIKSKSDKYDKDMPLIIAVNSHKTVGVISYDEYVLRKLLFGLGNATISRKSDDTFVSGLENNPKIIIPNKTQITPALFRKPEFSHISGIIYSSYDPINIIRSEGKWSNRRIIYIENPLAKNKADIEFSFFKKVICTEEMYQEMDPEDDSNN